MTEMINFEDIRSFRDDEYRQKAAELLKEPYFKAVISAIMPEIDFNLFGQKMMSLNSIYEFQSEIIAPFVNKLITKTTSSLEGKNIEIIDKNRNYLYISNHRDIVMDASLLCIILHNNGYDTCEIAIGDNLLSYQWIKDLVRINKSFIVKRSVGVRQALEAAKQLSAYIRYCINDKKQSVWIAQREGRAKDSNDRTQESLIKMLTLSSNESILDAIRQLNIAPVAISYEYDPCDSLKAYELLQKSKNPNFKKSEKDDLISMQTGIMGYKGRVNYHFTPCINEELKAINPELDKASILQSVSQIIDRHIYRNYHIYAINYIAYDLLHKSERFAQEYDAEQQTKFHKYIQGQIEKLGELTPDDYQSVYETMLIMYSYPLKNKLTTEEIHL